MSDKVPQQPDNPPKYQPGEGIRSMKSTTLFRAVNFELYAKPNLVIMAIGAVCFGGALGYITYMRSKYESQGYYAAVQSDGTEVYTKRRSKWE
ncbi:small integral membrane protein 8 [Contarinia nasturtii]|uniref:small integral membrane protein 8 n=1 Tax=Contarinia nasturtii TaxID=265458 RepID=UPI0012D3E93E|nr:small integral membrane protein 8 [Contarinia nasturtii]